jgi:hypothetical protein
MDAAIPRHQTTRHYVYVKHYGFSVAGTKVLINLNLCKRYFSFNNKERAESHDSTRPHSFS